MLPYHKSCIAASSSMRVSLAWTTCFAVFPPARVGAGPWCPGGVGAAPVGGGSSERAAAGSPSGDGDDDRVWWGNPLGAPY